MSRLICPSAALLEGGDALRFELDTPEGMQAAFVFRWQGGIYAYLNKCAHVGIELDWNPGKFLDAAGEFLMCAAHGAIYAPESGLCVAGPCVGRSLQCLPLLERDGFIYLEAEHD